MRDRLPVSAIPDVRAGKTKKFIHTAAARSAYAIILDLVDAVAPSEKHHHRSMAAALPHINRNVADALVRAKRPLNQPV
jgi:citrate lyase beta subunit